jgi:hypothetical protein
MIAYLILAHHRPDQLGRLVDRLDDGDTRFFIHIDRNAVAEIMARASALLARRNNVAFVDAVACRWGDMSLVDAALRCLEAALDATPRFEIAVLLSGQDYPIKRNEEISRFFGVHADRPVMEVWRLPSERWANEDFGRERYLYWNIRLGRRFLPILGPRRFRKPWLDRAWNGVARHAGLMRRFPCGMTPYGGFQWWAMTYNCAVHVVRFIAENAAYRRFFRWVKLPDEMYIQTIVMNSPHAASVLNRSLHYMSWPPLGASSPRILDAESLPDLAASEALFARKFDELATPGLLDRIDYELLHELAPPWPWRGSA